VAYALSGRLSGVERFLAEVGVDDAMAGRGSVVFIVELKREGEWSQVFKSPMLRGGRGAQSIEVDISGAEAIRLVTTDAGDNIHADHAVWGAARVE
jgi:alpha-L-fucosidase